MDLVAPASGKDAPMDDAALADRIAAELASRDVHAVALTSISSSGQLCAYPRRAR